MGELFNKVRYFVYRSLSLLNILLQTLCITFPIRSLPFKEWGWFSFYSIIIT
jgi:hypothetical protein